MECERNVNACSPSTRIKFCILRRQSVVLGLYVDVAIKKNSCILKALSNDKGV